MDENFTIRTKAVSFQKRLWWGMMDPWLWIVLVIFAFKSLESPAFLIIGVMLLSISFLIQYLTQKNNIECISFDQEKIEIEYWVYNKKAPNLIIYPLDLRVRYYPSTKGWTGGHRLSIGVSGNTLLRQFTNQSWNVQQLKDLNEKLLEIQTAVSRAR